MKIHSRYCILTNILCVLIVECLRRGWSWYNGAIGEFLKNIWISSKTSQNGRLCHYQGLQKIQNCTNNPKTSAMFLGDGFGMFSAGCIQIGEERQHSPLMNTPQIFSKIYNKIVYITCLPTRTYCIVSSQEYTFPVQYIT